jgi:hypothetical protein
MNNKRKMKKKKRCWRVRGTEEWLRRQQINEQDTLPFELLAGSPNVNGSGTVCDQKNSKFFVSHQEELMPDTWCKGILLKVRDEKYQGKHGSPGRVCWLRDHVSAFQVLLKPTTYGKKWTRWFTFNNQWVGRGLGSSQPGESGSWAKVKTQYFFLSPELALLWPASLQVSKIVPFNSK